MISGSGAILSRFRALLVLPLAGLLGACSTVVLAPAGDIAIQQRDLLFQSVVLMLLIIVPVMALIVLFAWRYRSSNRDATYEPDWDHSMHLELVIWSAPLLIIICLGAITWVGTHLLDPYRPLDRLAAGTPVAADAEAARGQRGGARLEVAVHLPRTRHRHGQRTGGAGRPADRLPHHGLVGDELVLHPRAGRPDLRHAGHADAAARRHQQAGRIQGLLRQLQRRGLLRACTSPSTA